MVAGDIYGDTKFEEYDSAGHALDSTTINGHIELIDSRADGSGNWYVLAKYFDTVYFPDGSQFTRDPYATPGLPGYFVFRLNSGSLSIKWIQQVGTTNAWDAAAFTLANNNLYLVADSFASFYLNTCICMVDTGTGAIHKLWDQVGVSAVHSIAVDASGNIYLSGGCMETDIDFNGHMESLSLTQNNYIVRYKANGVFDWILRTHDYPSGSSGCSRRTLSIVNNDFIYYSGELKDSMTLGAFILHKPNLNNSFMAARLDSSGNVYWARQQGDTTDGGITVENVRHAAVTSDSCLHLFVYIRGAINLGNGIITSAPLSHSIAAIVCINPDSTAKWVKYITGVSTHTTQIVSWDKYLYLTGNGYDTASFQFDSLTTPVILDGYTPYIAKLNTAYAPDTTHSSSIETIAATGFIIMPNPATNYVFLEGLDEYCNAVSMQMTDIYGRAVAQYKYAQPSHVERISTANLPRGLYVIKISGKNFVVVKKLVLQ